MRRIAFVAAMLVLVALALPADTPWITITAPNGHHPLFKHETETIRWTHSGYFAAHPQTCQIYCGDHVISPPVAVTADSFSWVVGRKADGTFLPQGRYEITIESPDFDALDGPIVVVSDQRPEIVLTAPASGASLRLGSACTIRWTFSSYFLVVPQTCRIFCGDGFISPPVPVLNGEYLWTVGRKDDGTYLNAGTYPITLESDDYDALSGPMITLSAPDFRIPIRRFAEKIWLHRLPGQPLSFRVDPSELKINLGEFLEPVTILLAHGGRTLAKLGRLVPGQKLPGPVTITLSQKDCDLVRGRQSGFEILLQSTAGKILQRLTVQPEVAAGAAGK